MKKKAQKMTIEKFARMSQREFLSVGERFDRVDQKLEKNSEDMGILRRDMETGFQSVGEVLKLMREDLKDIKGGVITMNEDYAELRARVTRLEKKVGLPR
ncbi:MAG: hypothetical protein A2945_00605 [Candidatus Liptonbacteria bacterium RIFCSPLOWO2_01_FULL_52_25]|uniref:Uncharacterized protein n=1 Tax=Candidatus Liptonbacteria bacterium RIFCSPLOWO2_01_FULL_52_25 TaxID=1798650 RepID=A0A1G2CF33_9BACT|nr:MAG: hypothetical protein A2945_00605 [Candidatus Liptonbacteria bacterium RIFCSPLOWO2_01_FULL_52_25]